MSANEMIPPKSTYIIKNTNETTNSDSQSADRTTEKPLPVISPRLDCTFDIKQINNETITINANQKYMENTNKEYDDSLLTDDNSENETPPPISKIAVVKKPNKELFK